MFIHCRFILILTLTGLYKMHYNIHLDMTHPYWCVTQWCILMSSIAHSTLHYNCFTWPLVLALNVDHHQAIIQEHTTLITSLSILRPLLVRQHTYTICIHI
jgi:hypothetical protein